MVKFSNQISNLASSPEQKFSLHYPRFEHPWCSQGLTLPVR